MPHQLDNGTEGIWLFSRYHDVAAILRNTGNISKDKSRQLPADRLNAVERMLLNMDPPEHTRLRAKVAPWFSVRRMVEMESRIEGLVLGLLTNITPGEKVDFIDAFALRLPLLVIAGILGVPAGDMLKMKGWTDDLMTGFDSGLSNQDIQNKQADSMQALTEFLSSLIATQKPGNESLISYLNQFYIQDHFPSVMEILSISILIVLAGYETTVNLLGNGMRTLLLHPEQMTRLRGNPDLLNSAIDEMLRFESPLQRSTYRVTTKAISIGGFRLEKDQQVSAVIGAANRDPDQFPNPDTFDITRTPNRHVAFGLGIHKCLGERLARLEARIAFKSLLENFSCIELASTEADWQQKTLFRGLKSLHIRFDDKNM
jgi:cytochrome P450